MKIAAVIAAACAGALVALAVPKSLDGASDVLRAFVPHERQAMHKVPPPAAKPAEVAAPSLKLDLGSAFEGENKSHTPQYDRRIEKLQAYAHMPPVSEPPAK
ncbi:MAG TPA: hypothetical protein VF835_04605 [Rhizomicrobium sp.]